MKFVKLTQIVSDARAAVTTTEEGEDDRMVTTIVEAEVPEVTRPFYVVPGAIRSVRPRTEGNGTRVEFPNGGAVPVKESVEEVVGLLENVG